MIIILISKGGVIARGNLFLESPVNRDTEDTSWINWLIRCTLVLARCVENLLGTLLLWLCPAEFIQLYSG